MSTLTVTAARTPDPNRDLLTIEDLAALLCRAPQTIRNDRARAPHRVPPPCRPAGTVRLLWLRQDVMAWLAAAAEPATPPPSPSRRPRGRPRKTAEKEVRA